MKFETSPIGDGIAAVRGVGRLNMVSAPALRETVAVALAAGRTRIVIDLSGVDFVDSSGLGALIGCLKSARQLGGDLRIAQPTAQVEMVLQLSNLDRVLKSYGSTEEAYSD
ncbi:anti-sigma factor antagonist [Salinibacterium xinjiangense]|uniref:Anti-sigma factor antagonist n=1 Tax=Salinibacterium xinjiangense TaxID=386302 RepID=A0A2C8YQY6_9MICO|nr:STAS domain-containing protein [Salinibacterium xinjiangense]GGK98367.1 anti-sigma factor antagonist [Salinibacterium xinjiangense]SOE52960.1 anti-sigma B factor antagonist [Salinibacterium xinjiangense]